MQKDGAYKQKQVNQICMCVKLYPCTHVWESEQEMARMYRIPNFPHGLFLGRKLQLSFGLSMPLIVEGRDLWVRGRRPPNSPVLWVDPVVYQKMKKVYRFSSLKLHGAILPPKNHLSALLPLNVAPYGALWLQTYPFGGSPAWLSVLAIRHDIMPGWRQAGRGYGYNQMSLHCVCQRSLRCFHM